MKSAAKTPGKLLAGLCLILFFCLMPVRSYAAEQQLSEITKLYVTGIYGSETLPQQKVNWQYADKGYSFISQKTVTEMKMPTVML